MKQNASQNSIPLRAVGSGPIHGIGVPHAARPLRRPKLTAFLLCFLCAAIFVVPFTLVNDGIFYVSNDQITQQIPLAQQVVKLLHGGNFLYDFGMDLGTGVIESYSWYNLGSVFTLIYLLFPAAATPYLMAPALLIKFGCSGLFAYLWMRRYTKTDLAALCGSLLYSFSGIFITNLVFPFADVYALFPLLPLGMDKLMEDKTPGLFAVAVALNILVNPPLFFGAAVFMVLYFAVKWLYKAYHVSIKQFLLLCAETVCGVALSGALLLPFVASLAANPRVDSMLRFGKDWFLYIAYRYFELLRSLVLPAEVMHQNSLMITPDAVSPELYLPLFGLVPVFAWVLSKRRDWLRGLLIASLACLFVPILNSAFNAFNGTYYTRWVYMPVLCAALCTVLWLEDDTVPLKRGFVAFGALGAAFAGCMVLWRVRYGYEAAIIHQPLFWFSLILCAAGLLLTARAHTWWKRTPRTLVALAAAFGIATGAANLYTNQRIATADYGPLPQLAQNTIYAGAAAPLPDGVYRIYAPGVSNTYFGHGSPFSFNSTLPGGIFELQAAFGRQRTSVSYIEFDEVGLWSLLGVQYLLAPADTAGYPLPNVKLVEIGEPFSVFENKDALPLVIGFDAALRTEDADALDNRQKSIVMLHGVVLEEATLAALSQNASSLDAASLPGLSYEDGVAARRQTSATDVQLGNGTATARITLPKDGLILITLPHDTGWRCTINGEEVPLHKADYGLMAAACPAGENTVVLRYHPPGSTAGLVLSFLGLLGLGLLCFFGRRTKKHMQKPEQAAATSSTAAAPTPMPDDFSAPGNHDAEQQPSPTQQEGDLP